MIRFIVHLVIIVERFWRHRSKHHVIWRVSGSGCARRWLPVSVSFSGGTVGASVARTAEYDVENFQHGYETGAEKQRQQAAHVTWLNHSHKCYIIIWVTSLVLAAAGIHRQTYRPAYSVTPLKTVLACNNPSNEGVTGNSYANDFGILLWSCARKITKTYQYFVKVTAKK